jgi:hypothetical protein
MLPDSRLISAMVISNANPIVKLVSVCHGRPALSCGAFGGDAETDSRTSSAIDLPSVAVVTDAYLFRSAGLEVTARP